MGDGATCHYCRRYNCICEDVSASPRPAEPEPPKADTGTLEKRLTWAIETERSPYDGDDTECYYCDVDRTHTPQHANTCAWGLLRDALTELRRLRAEIAINKHARALSLLGRSSEQEAREEGLREKLAEAEIRAEQAEARASSPDLRGLVEKEEPCAGCGGSGFGNTANESPRPCSRCGGHGRQVPSKVTALVELWRKLAEDRGHEMGVAYAVCASELEAALTGTGEQKKVALQDEIERLKKALERAGEAIHSEYCTRKCNPECEAVTAALAPETGAT